MFNRSHVYTRSKIHDRLGGQQRGGISTPADYPVILLFTGKQGEQYGYIDGYNDEGIYMYTGEGQVGDMTFKRGNQAVRDHIDDRKDIHLFEHVEHRQCQYLGQMVCIGYHMEQRSDRKGNQRQAIVFELAPIEAVIDDSLPEALYKADIEILRQQALRSTSSANTARERREVLRERSSAVRQYVLARANGICEACGDPAPFRTTNGTPFLETHHIARLSDGGPDSPHWVAGVCPNCHRQAHYGEDGPDLNNRLKEIVRLKEMAHSTK